MNCKNCGHGIKMENGRYQHYPVKGDLSFCTYYGDECDCGCKRATLTDRSKE